MTDFIKNIESKIKEIINSCGYETDTVLLVPSARPDLGDYQYNGVMSLAKVYHKNPIEIANEIVDKLKDIKELTNVNVAGPGFINVSFTNEALIEYFENTRYQELDYSKNENKKVIIDYGGPNVAKTLHVGHLRSADIGEALKRLAKRLGYDVISDVHLGDWGRQMGLVMLELRLMHPEWVFFDENYNGEYPTSLPITKEDLDNLYPIASNKAKEDEQYLESAREITFKLQQKEKGYVKLWEILINNSTEYIKKLYDILNVSFDLWLGESDSANYIDELFELLESKGLIKDSEGAKIIDVSNEDDQLEIPPLLLEKSNGAISYETTDLATIYQRMKDYNPDEIWYVVDKRQELHFTQVFRAAYKSGIVPENVKLKFIGFGTMNGKDGKPFKTRDGGVMTLESLINLVKDETSKKLNDNILESEKDEVTTDIAVGALKYADLLSDRSTDYIFDVEKFSDLNGKTGVYLLYSTLRMKSLLTKAKESNITDFKITSINNDIDRNIYLKLLEVSSNLDKSYNEKSLHDITDFLYELTNRYNSFYSAFKVLNEENTSLRDSWLALTEIVYKTNIFLLDILGIKLPKKM